MTKLQRKLKQMKKKRAHRRNVDRRKLARQQGRLAAEAGSSEVTLPADADFDSMLAAAETQKVKLPKQRTHLTRKQLRRKMKKREKGEQQSEQYLQRAASKLFKVKRRAQIRNEDLE